MEKEKRLDMLFSIAWGMFLVTKIFLTETYWADNVAVIVSALSKILYLGVIVIFAYLLLDNFFYGTNRYRIIVVIVLGCLGISFLITGRITLLFSAVFVILSKNGTLKKLMNIYFYTAASCLGLLVVFCALGITIDFTWEWPYGVGHSLGRLHPNGLGLLVLCVILAWEYLNSEKNLFLNSIVAWCGAAFVYAIPKSRTAAILLVVFPVLLFFVKMLEKRNMLRILGISQYVVPFFFAFSFITMYFVEQLKSILHFSSLMARFTLALPLYEEYGVRLFGNHINFIGETEALESGVVPVVLDNGYLFLLIDFGVLAAVIFVVAYSWLLIRCYKNEDYILLIISCIFLVYGLMEQYVFMAQYNFALLGIMAVMEPSSYSIGGSD